MGLPKQSNSYQSTLTTFILEVPLCNLLTSMCDFVPCDRILRRAYLQCFLSKGFLVRSHNSLLYTSHKRRGKEVEHPLNSVLRQHSSNLILVPIIDTLSYFTVCPYKMFCIVKVDDSWFTSSSNNLSKTHNEGKRDFQINYSGHQAIKEITVSLILFPLMPHYLKWSKEI